MTAELDMLIAEQKRDDNYRVHTLSLDAFPSGADLVQRRSRMYVTDPRHGTLNCYTNYACRCLKCRAAAAEYKREQRRRQGGGKKGPFTYRLCCQGCGSSDVKRRRVYAADVETDRAR